MIDSKSRSRAVVSSRPVDTLREQSTALEAAIAVVLARPGKKAIHAVRTSTRRIEAGLELLGMLKLTATAHPKTEKHIHRLRKLLNRVRKAAGRVRDLDVQRKILKEDGRKSASRRLSKQARKLRRQLKRERAVEAKTLQGTLRGHALEIGPRLERLLKALEPVAEVSLTAKQTAAVAEEWYKEHSAEASYEKQSVQQMHGIRKAAKLARYMAESGGERRAAEQFEHLQESGGEWHDLLTLRDVSADALGQHSELTTHYKRRERNLRHEFQAMTQGAP